MRNAFFVIVTLLSQVACNTNTDNSVSSCILYLHHIELIENEISNMDSASYVSAEYFLSACNCDSTFLPKIEHEKTFIGSRKVHEANLQTNHQFNDSVKCDKSQILSFSLYSIFKNSIDSATSIKLVEQDIANEKLSLELGSSTFKVNCEHYKGAFFLPPYLKR